MPAPVAPPQRRPARLEWRFGRRVGWLGAIDLALDTIDEVADLVAEATGVRRG